MDPNFHVISATFNHKFTKFSQINKLTPSPACWIQNMPWKIFIEPAVRDKKKYLSIFVSCAAPITNNKWSCKASVRMYKLDGKRPKIIRTTQYLNFDSSASTSWGHDNFILWDAILNPANGYIQDDSIIIEIIIDAETPVGLKLTSTYFTDERATAAVKLCDQTILGLQTRLQELTNQIQVLESTNNTAKEQIQNLETQLHSSEKKSADFEENFNNKTKANIELQKLIDDYNNRLIQEKDKNENLTRILNENNTTIESLNEKIKEFKTTKEELTNCNKQKKEALRKYTALLDEFENYRKPITSSGTESENVLKTEINKMKSENVELKEQFSSLQNELNDANVKLKQVDTLKRNLQELKEEKTKMQKTIDLISEELSKAETIIETIKKESSDEQKKNRKEKGDCETQIQKLKSQLYESLIKVQISQDMNEEIEKVKSEKNKLIEQMKIGYEKYKNLKQEKITLNSQIVDLNKQLSNANENINNLKTEVESKQKEIQNCKDQLEISNSSLSDLKKLNTDLKASLDEAKSTIISFENNSSENLTKLVDENNDLKNNNNELKLQVQSVEKKLKDLEDKKLYEQISSLVVDKTDLENKLTSVNKELEETKIQLMNAQKDINKMIILQNNLSSLQNHFDATKNKLKQLEDKKLDEAVSKLKDEKQALQDLLSSLKQEQEKTKSKLINTETEGTQQKTLKEENVKLKEQITSLQNILDRTNSKIQNIHNQKNQNTVQTQQNEDPDFGVDLVKSIGNVKKEPVQKLKVVKTPRSSGQEDEENLNVPEKDSLEMRLENMRKEFEKQITDTDHAMQVERGTLMKRINDLFFQLSEAKQKQEDSMVAEAKMKEEIGRIKEETNASRNMKDDCVTQLKTAQTIFLDAFHIIIDILRNLKMSGKISCTVEAQILSFFNSVRQFGQLWINENSLQSTVKIENQQQYTEISTDVLQAKLEELRTNQKESLSIIEKNSALEHDENSRLRKTNNDLLVVIENEIRFTKQYKKMLLIANSRLENYRRQFNELDKKLLDEKNRRCEYEEISRRTKVFGDDTEFLLNDLKRKLLRHAIELSDTKTSDLNETETFQRGNSNDDGRNFSCSAIVNSCSTMKSSLESSSRSTVVPEYNGNENAPLLSNSQQFAAKDDSVRDNETATEKPQNVSSSNNNAISVNTSEINDRAGGKKLQVQQM